MSMQILTVVLYNRRGQQRRIDFKTGQVNIITGDRDTGKSAIIHIVEYCMGRADLDIVDDVIRRHVVWYGVLFQVNDTRAFIAKPTPDENKTRQSKAYIEQGNNIDVPRFSKLTANSTDSDIRIILSRLIRTTASNPLVTENQALETLKTSVEQAIYYLFQRSNEIANPEMLFHRQQEQSVPQIIKDTLPYFLGVVQEDDILDRRELERVQLERRAVLNKLQSAEALRDKRAAEMKVLLKEAQEVGLINSDILLLDDEAIPSALTQTQEWKPDIVAPIEDDRLPGLREELNRIQLQFRRVEQEIVSTEAFIRESEGYSREASEQVMRLEAINVFQSPDDLLSDICPLCSSVLPQKVPQVASIRESLSKLNTNLQYVEREESALRQYIRNLRDQKEQIRRQMTDIRAQIRLIAEDYVQQKDILQQSTISTDRISTVKGMIKYYLRMANEDDDASALVARSRELEQRIEELKGKLSEDQKEDTLESFLHDLSGQMTEWAKALELSYDGFYRLDLRKLTITVLQGRQVVPMRQMGGSKNPLGCHLVTHLALHKHFIEQERPVPSFLILDQPAQGYFPSRAAYEALNDSSNSQSNNLDMLAVTRMFNFLIEVCASLSPNFQIIVLEHAELDDENFRAARQGDRWTADNALVPKNWMSQDESFQQITID